MYRLLRVCLWVWTYLNTSYFCPVFQSHVSLYPPHYLLPKRWSNCLTNGSIRKYQRKKNSAVIQIEISGIVHARIIFCGQLSLSCEIQGQAIGYIAGMISWKSEGLPGRVVIWNSLYMNYEAPLYVKESTDSFCYIKISGTLKEDTFHWNCCSDLK